MKIKAAMLGHCDAQPRWCWGVDRLRTGETIRQIIYFEDEE